MKHYVLLFKMNLIIKFEKVIPYLRYISGKVLNNLNENFISLLSPIRKILFRFQFLNLDYRLDTLNVKDIQDIKNEDNLLKSINFSKSLLGSKYMNMAKRGLNIRKNLSKAAWCISSDNDIRYKLEDFLSDLQEIPYQYLLQDGLNTDLLRLVHPFYFYGDMYRANMLLIELKKYFELKEKKSPSLVNEASYFSAIGHMSLIFSLLQAIHSGLLDTNKTPVSLIYDKRRVKNKEYASLIASRCQEYGVNLIEPSEDIKKEYNMDLWPISQNNVNSYVIASHFYASSYQQSISGPNKLILKPRKKHIEIGEKLIKENFAISPNWFVGMHLRTANDSDSLRNANFKNCQFAINKINSLGGCVFLTGTKNNRKAYSILNSCFDITKLELNKYELECLSIYIWSHSRFFIGSLSGGTHPPTTFGVPTIWLDNHPNVFYRAPNPLDIILPKKVFFKKEMRFLSFKESISKSHSFCQTKNFNIARENGYSIKNVSFDLIELAIKKMMEIKNNDELEAIEHPNALDYVPLNSGANILTESSLEN